HVRGPPCAWRSSCATWLGVWTCVRLPLFFFFFQAEDGIRDPLVTGVQTCALPISEARPPRFSTHRGGRAHAGTEIRPTPVFSWRSEERRVGKECRARWEREHGKKKERVERKGGEEGKAARRAKRRATVGEAAG